MDKSLDSLPEHTICAHEIYIELKSFISSGALRLKVKMIFRIKVH